MLDIHNERGYSQQLADFIEGDYDLSDLPHEAKVNFLRTLKLGRDAMFTMGWAEHTNDWDWRLSIHLEDGTIVGTNYDLPEDHPQYMEFSDDFKLPYQDEAIETGYTHWRTITVEILGDAPYATYQSVPIDKIHRVVFTEA